MALFHNVYHYAAYAIQYVNSRIHIHSGNITAENNVAVNYSSHGIGYRFVHIVAFNKDRV